MSTEFFVKENLAYLWTFRNCQFVRPLADRPEKARAPAAFSNE